MPYAMRPTITCKATQAAYLLCSGEEGADPHEAGWGALGPALPSQGGCRRTPQGMLHPLHTLLLACSCVSAALSPPLQWAQSFEGQHLQEADRL